MKISQNLTYYKNKQFCYQQNCKYPKNKSLKKILKKNGPRIDP